MMAVTNSIKDTSRRTSLTTNRTTLLVTTDMIKDSTAKPPPPTTVLSILPPIVLEVVFSYLNCSSIEDLYEADPYVEHLMDSLLSVQRMKERFFAREEEEFREKQFALWRERLRMIHQQHRKKVD